MDGLIEECKREDCEVVAYADDGAIIVWGESRREIERKGTVVLERV